MPFTTEQFLSVFERYNLAIWPAQVVAYLVGLVAVALAVRPTRYAGRLISGALALFWLWTGAVYHLLFFREINPLAAVFGVVFVAQGLAWLWAGVWRPGLTFRARPGLVTVVGGLFLLYALAIYPLLGWLSGHTYPRSPSFGLTPCPVTIFTFGLLLWTTNRVPKYLLVIPLLWSLFGFSAASALGIREDYGLVVAGVLGTALLLWRDRVRSPDSKAGTVLRPSPA